MTRLIDLDELKRQADAGELHPNQITALIEESRQLRRLIKRAIKYAREDRMVTPKKTRLQRVLDECERLTTEEDPTP